MAAMATRGAHNTKGWSRKRRSLAVVQAPSLGLFLFDGSGKEKVPVKNPGQVVWGDPLKGPKEDLESWRQRSRGSKRCFMIFTNSSSRVHLPSAPNRNCPLVGDPGRRCAKEAVSLF